MSRRLQFLNSSPVNIGNGIRYHEFITSIFGNDLLGYWPLWDASGTYAEDVSGNGYTGTYTTPLPTLQAELSPARYYSPVWGTGSSGNVDLGSDFISQWPADEGGVSIWYHPNEEDWTSGLGPRIFWSIASGSASYIQILISNNNLAIVTNFSGTSLSLVTNYRYRVGWNNVTLTWSKSQDKIRGYVNGGLDLKQTGLGTWVNDPSYVKFGTSEGAINSYHGALSDALIVNRFITSEEVYKICDWSGNLLRLSVLGDSISESYHSSSNWEAILGTLYTERSMGISSHAHASNSIVDDMDNQVIDAASDDADIIIIELGANDDNAGDMGILKGTIVENIRELQTSNRRATIYYMNVLPMWEDVTGAVEKDASNIRTAISEACTIAGITCWDTYTDPWITVADTSDGVHPSAAGALKIANRVLALIS